MGRAAEEEPAQHRDAIGDVEARVSIEVRHREAGRAEGSVRFRAGNPPSANEEELEHGDRVGDVHPGVGVEIARKGQRSRGCAADKQFEFSHPGVDIRLARAVDRDKVFHALDRVQQDGFPVSQATDSLDLRAGQARAVSRIDRDPCLDSG